MYSKDVAKLLSRQQFTSKPFADRLLTAQRMLETLRLAADVNGVHTTRGVAVIGTANVTVAVVCAGAAPGAGVLTRPIRTLPAVNTPSTSKFALLVPSPVT